MDNFIIRTQKGRFRFRSPFYLYTGKDTDPHPYPLPYKGGEVVSTRPKGQLSRLEHRRVGSAVFPREGKSSVKDGKVS